MKKNISTLLLSLILLFSCSNDNDSSTEDNNILSGTHWVKTTNSERHLTFKSTTEYVYSENGKTYSGTYTFDGSSGKMYEKSSSFVLDFKVNGDILSANQNTTNPDFEALYKKQ